MEVKTKEVVSISIDEILRGIHIYIYKAILNYYCSFYFSFPLNLWLSKGESLLIVASQNLEQYSVHCKNIIITLIFLIAYYVSESILGPSLVLYHSLVITAL